MKNKFKSSAFWLSVTAGVIVLLNSLGSAFNFNVNDVAITSVATSVIGLLVVIGLLKNDKTKTQNNNKETEKQNKLQDELNNKIEEIEEKTSEISNSENKKDC